MDGRYLALVAAVIVVASGCGGAEAESHSDDPGGLETLEQGFRFASAIEGDDEGKGRSQLEVVMAMAEIGALEAARDAAEATSGWHQGVAFAELAAELARRGRSEEARESIERAREVQRRTTGWQGPRISAHIASALAETGAVDDSRKLTQTLAANDPRQYSGRAAATQALARAERGEFESAMKVLAPLDGNDDLEVAWWRTTGYLDIAGQEAIPRAKRIEALDAAWASARQIAGATRVEALRSVAEQYESLGKRKRSREALDEAKTFLDRGTTVTAASSPTALAALARSWAALGEVARARDLLRQAEQSAIRASTIDRPGLLGQVGASYRALQDEAEQRRVLDQALTLAERLANSRPRALAVADICRAMGLQGIPLDPATRERLGALYAGLGDPW
jgi:tetratricopeptide (TPR) repeat protein